MTDTAQRLTDYATQPENQRPERAFILARLTRMGPSPIVDALLTVFSIHRPGRTVTASGDDMCDGCGFDDCGDIVSTADECEEIAALTGIWANHPDRPNR